MATDESGVAVIGAGGHAKVVVATLQAAGQRVAGLFDADQKKWGTSLLGLPILGAIDRVESAGLRRAVLAIGDNAARRRLAETLALDWVSAAHPTATIHPSVVLGPGTMVFAGAVIQPDTLLAAHCIVNTGASIDHDCRIGEFAHVAPGAHLAGGVAVGEGTLIGIGSCIAPGLTIGAWSTVGAGAAVVEEVADGATVTGVPAG